MGNLANLTVLDLSANQLVGAIPSGLGNLAALKELDLVGNQLAGEIPPELGNLANLEDLVLERKSVELGIYRRSWATWPTCST